MGGRLSVPVSMAGMSAVGSFWAVLDALAEGIETWRPPRWVQVVRGSARSRLKAAAS